MRHGKKFNHLGRKPAHRKAVLRNMANSLIAHKRISTTLAKAKALQKFVEPLITKAKTDSTHSRRMVFKYLSDKMAINSLFNEISNKVSNREGGYTRILKTGYRAGDNAEMCFIELVDYNETYTTTKDTKKKRSRRGKKKVEATTEEPKAEAAAPAKEEVKEEAPKAEAKPKKEKKEEKSEDKGDVEKQEE
ncbi:MAG TPA: 50S ribosomal protein L17 [Bacteroidetes bacterium]|nr:50S ribosomal protein L17 [Bacteroidota bacterium]